MTTVTSLAPASASAGAPPPPRLAVRPLTASIGAELRGVDLRRPLDAATVAALRAAWLRHKVVFLPGQHLEPADQVRFARAFGPLTRAHPVVPGPLPEHPEVLVLDTWAAGDLAIWDNRTTMHYAAVDYGDAPRVMHRVTRRGDRPE
jgi:alpha-ketoglutarate-dependent taurine dioxygenase